MFCNKCEKDLGERPEIKFCPECGEQILENNNIQETKKQDKVVKSSYNIFFMKRFKNKRINKKKWIFKTLTVFIMILVVSLLVLDRGTAWSLLQNQNVKKVIWVPCRESFSDYGLIRTFGYSLGKVLFDTDRYYGTDGIRINAKKYDYYNAIDYDAKVIADHNEEDKTATFIDFSGKEYETIQMGNLVPSTMLDYNKGMMGINGMTGISGDRRYLNIHTGNIYEEFGEISDGYISVKKNGLYGYIDVNGNERIEPQYNYAGEFKNGWAEVEKSNGSRLFVDKNGLDILQINDSNSDIWGYNNSLIGMSNGIIDRDGNYVFKSQSPNFRCSFLDNTMIFVEDDGAYYILDSQGNIIAQISGTWNVETATRGATILRHEESDKVTYLVITKEGEIIESVDKVYSSGIGSIPGQKEYKELTTVLCWTNYGNLIIVNDDGKIINTDVKEEPGQFCNMKDSYYIEATNGRGYIVDKEGKVVNAEDSISLGEAESGLYMERLISLDEAESDLPGWRRKGPLYGLYDLTGKEILPKKYRNMNVASSNVVTVDTPGNLWEYIVVLEN